MRICLHDVGDGSGGALPVDGFVLGSAFAKMIGKISKVKKDFYELQKYVYSVW